MEHADFKEILARTSWIMIIVEEVDYIYLTFFQAAVVSILLYHIYLTPPLGQDMTQGEFF